MFSFYENLSLSYGLIMEYVAVPGTHTSVANNTQTLEKIQRT